MENSNVPETKIHSYNVSVAVDVGINAAIIFYNICFWVEQNHANKRNFINGEYWTYNTVNAFKAMFPEMTYEQVRNALKKLEDKKYIKSAFLSDDVMDRTKYYAVCDFEKWISGQKCICENPQMNNCENSQMQCDDSQMDCENSQMFNNINNIKNTKTDKNQSDKKQTDNSHESKGERNARAREGDCEQSESQTNTQEWYTLKDQLIKAMKELGYKQGSKTTKDALSTFGYFILLRKKQAGLPYPKMTDNEMTAVAKSFLKARGLNNRALIEKYFEDGCDADDGWDILHFMQSHVSDSVAVNT